MSNDDKLIVAQQAHLISRQNKVRGFLENDVDPGASCATRLELAAGRPKLAGADVLCEEKMLRNLKWMQRFMTSYNDLELGAARQRQPWRQSFSNFKCAAALGITLATAAY